MLKKTLIFGLGGWLLIGVGLEAGAAEFKVIPSVALKGEYNDNVFFDEEDEMSDFIL